MSEDLQLWRTLADAPASQASASLRAKFALWAVTPPDMDELVATREKAVYCSLASDFVVTVLNALIDMRYREVYTETITVETATLSTYILSNQIECLRCGGRPFSSTVHDYRSCGCGNVSVDGGQHYARRGWRGGKAEDSFRDLLISWPRADYDAAVAAVQASAPDGPGGWVAAYRAARGLDEALRGHLEDAAAWCLATGRNAHGVVCAMARVERDGEWRND